MILYLASDVGGAWDVDGVTSVKPISTENGFNLNLKSDLDALFPEVDKRACLVIAADPYAHDANDRHIEVFKQAFAEAGIEVGRMDICDGRSPKLIENLDGYSMIFLIGGFAPKQNRFFKDIGLKAEIRCYNGIIISMSAGSMNCAKTVYMIPEEEEDFKKSTSERFTPGLGLTGYSVIPHIQYLKTLDIDGKNLVDDIIREDSEGHDFIGLCDGSYFRIEEDDSNSMLYGEAYGISDGEIWKL